MADKNIEFREVGWLDGLEGKFFIQGYGWRIKASTKGTMSDGLRAEIEKAELRLERLRWALNYFDDCIKFVQEERTNG